MIRKKIEKISKILLSEDVKEKEEINEYNGIRLTNEYNDLVYPIGMLDEEEKSILRNIFKDKISKYYYVERI